MPEERVIGVGVPTEGVTVTDVEVPPVVLVHAVFPTLLTQYVVVVIGDAVNVDAVCPAITLLPTVPVPHWNIAPEPLLPPIAVRIVL